jgi:hypothetical protein
LWSESGQKVVRKWSEGCDFEFEFWILFGAWCLEFGICLVLGAWNLELSLLPLPLIPSRAGRVE